MSLPAPDPLLAEVCLDMLDDLEEYGWIKGLQVLRYPEYGPNTIGEHCLIGEYYDICDKIYRADYWQLRRYSIVLDRYATILTNCSSIVTFNDHPSTTFEDVRNFLLTVAVLNDPTLLVD